MKGQSEEKSSVGEVGGHREERRVTGKDLKGSGKRREWKRSQSEKVWRGWNGENETH